MLFAQANGLGQVFDCPETAQFRAPTPTPTNGQENNLIPYMHPGFWWDSSARSHLAMVNTLREGNGLRWPIAPKLVQTTPSPKRKRPAIHLRSKDVLGCVSWKPQRVDNLLLDLKEAYGQNTSLRVWGSGVRDIPCCQVFMIPALPEQFDGLRYFCMIIEVTSGGRNSRSNRDAYKRRLAFNGSSIS